MCPVDTNLPKAGCARVPSEWTQNFPGDSYYMSYYIILCYIILCYVILYYIILFYIILNYIKLNYIILYLLIQISNEWGPSLTKCWLSKHGRLFQVRAASSVATARCPWVNAKQRMLPEMGDWAPKEQMEKGWKGLNAQLSGTQFTILY